jgi:hypothetical protein
MSDIEVTTEAVADPDIPVEGEGFEVVVGPESDPEDKTAELEAKNNELAAQLEALKAAQQTAVPATDGFSELAAEIRKIGTPVQAAPEAPQGTDYETLLKEVGQDFYKDPAMNVARIVGPAVNDVKMAAQAQIDQQAMQISKLTVLNTPGDKDLYVKYKDEAEELAAKSANKAQAYQDAMKQVKANHMDELIAAQVEEKLNEAISAAEGKATGATSTPSAPLPVDVSTMPRKPAKVTTRITPQQWSKIAEWSLIKGYDLGTPENPGSEQAWVINYMKSKGVIK